MAFDLDGLIACLEMTEVEPGVVEGQNLDIGYHRVFGGQIIAQMVTAAAQASPDKSVKSLTVLFPREGDTAKPMRYRVDKLQDGRTFGTTQITATQDDKVISAAVVSMHADEDGLHHSAPLPSVGAPDTATQIDVPMVPWEVRSVGGVDLVARDAGPPRYEMWMRAGSVVDSRALHQALLAHATDLTIIGTALRPFEGVSQADSTVTLHTAVTSHSMWFHQPFRIDEWFLIAQESPVVANGRGFGRGEVFTEAGECVASFAQESMIRRLEPKP
ncbi:MAG: acyl-CoA thioesterase domain-containing protein [Acidimicrobiales bacterium]